MICNLATTYMWIAEMSILCENMPLVCGLSVWRHVGLLLEFVFSVCFYMFIPKGVYRQQILISHKIKISNIKKQRTLTNKILLLANTY